jgi:hypothetical protein
MKIYRSNFVRLTMDCRVKPGNDERGDVLGNDSREIRLPGHRRATPSFAACAHSGAVHTDLLQDRSA